MKTANGHGPIARTIRWAGTIGLVGMAGALLVGCAFAEALAARTLCAQPGADGEACGQCEDCQWRLAGSHPDLIRVIPEADQEDAESSSEKTGDAKAASRQIVIDQIRDLQQSLTTGSHHGGQRVVIVDPAEAMNPFTANALLKLLEEPTTSVLFLLITSSPKRLLPTIRSRLPSPPKLNFSASPSCTVSLAGE